MRARKGRWRLLIVASVGILLIGEGIARIAPNSLHEVGATTDSDNSDSTLLRAHPTRIWSLTPGTNTNGRSTASINSLGLRGPEPTTPRTPDQPRILVMGDSPFFGHSVHDNETLSYFLENRLRTRGLDVDVINASAPGYSILQGRTLLGEVGWALEPTLLLLGFFWSDNHYAKHTDRDLLQRRRAARFNPLVHSALFQRAVERVTQVLQPERQTIDNSPSAWEDQMRREVEGEQRRRVALSDYAEQLATIAAAASDRGAGTVVLSPTNPGQVSGESPRLHSSWMPYYDAQAEIADAYGLVRIDALPVLQAAQVPREALFVDDIHPSGVANKIFAEAIADALMEAGWPKQSLQATPNPGFDPGARDDPHTRGRSTSGAGWSAPEGVESEW